MRRAGAWAAVAAALAAGPAAACFLERGPSGIATRDPLAIPVLVAGGAAVEAGRVAPIEGVAALAEATAVLSYVPRALDGDAFAGPAGRFAVLQARSGYWSRFAVADGRIGAEAHAGGPGGAATVIVVDDAALLSALRGGAGPGAMREAGLMRARGPGAEAALETYEAMLSRFTESRLGRLVASGAAPGPSG